MHGDELFDLIPSTLGRVASGMVAALSSIRHIHVTGRVRAMFMLFDVVVPRGRAAAGLSRAPGRGGRGGSHHANVYLY